MRLATIGPVLLIGLLAAPEAEAASILYTTTDLGTSYQIQSGAGGNDYGVTGSNGVTYAFDKVPVTSIDERQDWTNTQGFRYPFFAIETMKVGPYENGFIYDSSITNAGGYAGFAPITEGIGSGWYLPGTSVLYGTPYFRSPLLDMNAQGQIVGVSVTPDLKSTFAAFSAVAGQSHADPTVAASVSDNLNNYIATIPGVSLTSAVAIDDLGRIIAVGSDGHDYLVTPDALGPAATVPEPAALATLGAGVLIFLARTIRRRHRIG